MAWFGDGLPSLSNIKGQITNFTKEILTEGIVEEQDERTISLREANEKCVQLQELLNSKDAEISLLRRQNCELQKTVIDLNAKSKNSNDVNQEDNDVGSFWDPPSTKNRAGKNSNQTIQLQEQLAQATMRIRELEIELKRARKVNSSTVKDDHCEGHQKAEFLRAKQDMMNRIIQMEEKTKEAERNAKRSLSDETALIDDFRSVFSKLNVSEKSSLIKSALTALEFENKQQTADEREKCDTDEKTGNEIEESNLLGMENKETEFLKKIKELESENRDLLINIEKLDEQHNESINELLVMKEELNKKHECLQKAYENLYADLVEKENKILLLESKYSLLDINKTDSITESINDSINSVNQLTQTDTLSRIDNETQSDLAYENNEIRNRVIEELTTKLKGILKNSCVDVNPDETIFEAVAKHYIDANWKKEILEKKLNEVTRELKNVTDMKENLQVECDDLHVHIDQLLLQIQDLKLNLPSIPEASEEKVASLENEVETLEDYIKLIEIENKKLKEGNVKLYGSSDVCVSTSDDPCSEVNVSNCNDDFLNKLKNDLRASSEENKDLQKKVELLENSNTQIKEQLRMSLEKCKGLDENIELIEELKLDLENVKLELKVSLANLKRSETTISSLQEENRTIKKENKELFEKHEKLELEVIKWREISFQRDDKDLWKELQNQIDKASQEKSDLEYDLLGLRKELDSALHNVELKKNQIAQLNDNNELLVKENKSLLDQMTDSQKESFENVALLNTELSFLQLEYTELYNESISDKKEFDNMNNQLTDAKRKYGILKNEWADLKSKCELLKAENDNLRQKISEIIELDQKLNEKEEILQKLTSNTEPNSNESMLKQQLQSALDNCYQMTSQIVALQNEKTEWERYINSMNEKINANDELTVEIKKLKLELQAAIENNEESSQMAKETIESLSNLIKEKDYKINDLESKTEETVDISENILNLKNERNELVKLVQVKHNECLQYHAEIQRLTTLINEQSNENQKLISEKNASLSAIKEKETELLWTQNELQVLQQRLNNLEQNINVETCGIIEHSTLVADINILREKCNALEAALIQEQSNNKILHNQLIDSQNKEFNAAKELERLRSHLVEMESNFTEEVLIAEETRKELEARLLQAEEKVKNSSTMYTSASIRANQQVETLQQQMALIVQQRDDIQNKLSTAEDKILSQTAALTNLQIVLEQFQRDKEKSIAEATEKIQQLLDASYSKQEKLSDEIMVLKEQLNEAKECLQAASRLSEQLDKKSERIQQLTQEVEQLKIAGLTIDQREEQAKQFMENKVDKYLIKNLLLGYLASSATDKLSVLKVVATVLDFNDQERDKAGLTNTTVHNNWFTRLLVSDHGNNPTKEQEASLSAAFVRFLESESKPKPQLPPLPISSSPISRPGHSRQHSSSSNQSTLLLSNVSLPTFPDFIPARSTGSILKEVLKDS